MGRRAARGTSVDITPLIDILFILIIFFVLTAVFVQGAIDVALPGGRSVAPVSGSPIVLTVRADSSLLWAGEPITSADLAPRVADALAASDDILIAGDREAGYGDVAELLARLKELGVTSVGLAFEGSAP